MAIDPSTAFVSYSREDLEFANRLTTDLRAKGAKVWMDKIDILAGQRWEAEIEVAVGACSRVLVILSPASVASTNVMAEVGLAIDDGKQVVPVFFQECKVPFRLRPLQYADFRSDYDAGLQDLLETLEPTATQPAAAGTAHRHFPGLVAEARHGCCRDRSGDSRFLLDARPFRRSRAGPSTSRNQTRSKLASRQFWLVGHSRTRVLH
jgi:hypothetical protein